MGQAASARIIPRHDDFILSSAPVAGTRQPVLIIGGGLVGASLAIALDAAGSTPSWSRPPRRASASSPATTSATSRWPAPPSMACRDRSLAACRGAGDTDSSHPRHAGWRIRQRADGCGTARRRCAGLDLAGPRTGRCIAASPRRVHSDCGGWHRRRLEALEPLPTAGVRGSVRRTVRSRSIRRLLVGADGTASFVREQHRHHAPQRTITSRPCSSAP